MQDSINSIREDDLEHGDNNSMNESLIMQQPQMAINDAPVRAH